MYKNLRTEEMSITLDLRRCHDSCRRHRVIKLTPPLISLTPPFDLAKYPLLTTLDLSRRKFARVHVAGTRLTDRSNKQ